ncbi:MAG: tetratricopeptide repeat protein [Muribaculaceae bacterium]|nr:tetratricopeptide repeat protein [Muribaculaceae bacterium]
MNCFKYIISLFVTFILTGTMCHAAEVDQVIANADSAYKSEDFGRAITLYNQILEKDGSSAELLFNLGNAYSRSGDYGHALLSYLRALRIDPSNKNVKHNIEFITYKVAEANKSELRGKKYSLDAEPTSFFYSLKKYISADHTSNLWAAWSACSFFLFILALAAYMFTSDVLVRKIGFFGGFVCLGVSLITIIFAFMAASFKSDDGVIIEPKVKLHTEASISSKESPVALTRGTAMKILDSYPAGDKNPQWYKVKLNSDFIGWIQSSDFEPVEFNLKLDDDTL